MTRIRVRDARDAERQQALRLALSEPGFEPHHIKQVCQMTERFLLRCGGAIGGLHIAEYQEQMISACASLDLPGGVTLLMLPGYLPTQSPRPQDVQPADQEQQSQGPAGLPESPVGHLGLADLVAAACRSGRDRGRRFAQIMLEPPAAAPLRPVLEQAGFAYLATLQYMQRNAFDPAPVRPVEGINWLSLADTDEQTFADLIRRTYVDSHDCPLLTGVRSMQDVMDSHRSAGEYDPRGWYMLEHEGRPSGVLITARTPFRTTLEVVYVGLVPEARGYGLGRICMQRAIQRARDMALSAVSLAVDAANEPACRMYAAMGFSPYATKEVWIQVFRRADAEGLFALPVK